MYWTLKSIPELRPLLPSDRKRLWQAATRESIKFRDVALVLVFFAATFAICSTEDAVAAAIGKRWASILFGAFFVLSYQLVLFPVLAWRNRPVIRRLIAQGR